MFICSSNTFCSNIQRYNKWAARLNIGYTTNSHPCTQTHMLSYQQKHQQNVPVYRLKHLKNEKVHKLNTPFKWNEWTKINNLSWQTVPYINNTLTKKWFFNINITVFLKQFKWMALCVTVINTNAWVILKWLKIVDCPCERGIVIQLLTELGKR